MNVRYAIRIVFVAVVVVLVTRCDEAKALEIIPAPFWTEKSPNVWSRYVTNDPKNTIHLIYAQNGADQHFGVILPCPSITKKVPNLLRVAWKNNDKTGRAVGCGGENREYPVADLRKWFTNLPKPAFPEMERSQPRHIRQPITT